MSEQKAFRCKKCGHLVHAEHAGENLLPHSCPVCKAGVSQPIDQASKGRHDEIMAKLVKIDTPQLEREKLVAELVNLPREKVYHPDNWEVLSECKPERLKELGLEPEHVCAHKPAKITKPKQGRIHKVELKDGVTVASDDGKAKVG